MNKMTTESIWTSSSANLIGLIENTGLDSIDERKQLLNEYFKKESFILKMIRLGLAGNAFSMILNGVVSYALSTIDETKTVQLFPVLFQSLLDFVFTGLLPAVANSVLIHDISKGSTYNFALTTRRLQMCKIFTVCDSVARSSNGITITVVAFVR